MVGEMEINETQADKISVESEGIKFTTKHYHNPLKVFKIVVVTLIFGIFFTFATLHYLNEIENCKVNCESNVCSPYNFFVLLSSIVCFGIIYYQVVKRYFGEFLWKNFIEPCVNLLKAYLSSLQTQRLVSIAVIIILVILVFLETFDDFHRLRSLVGIASIIIFGYAFSYKNRAIKWRPVICGFTMQFLLGVVLMRWNFGRNTFKCLADKIAQFSLYSRQGAAFVFGNFLVEQYTFAFAILPTVIYMSLIISVLYYYGVMQWILKTLGWIFQSVIGTTVCESVNAAANIFLGQTESPLMIRPYIQFLTRSEIHSIMVSGFATVSGTVLVAYMSYGAEAYHLVTASVMAAPASLYISKLFYPETEKSLTSSENIKLEKSTDSSVLDAASNGAKNGMEIYLQIIANLIAFIAFLAFADSIVKYIFYLVGLNEVGIQFILGRLFIPCSWALGVRWEDCEAVGYVIGTKTFVNEFVAFKLLGEYSAAGKISHRSEAIATYAICGFGNPSAMGIMIGTLSALAPERRASITNVAFRAFIAGCMVSLINASIAGLLLTDELIEMIHEEKHH